MSPQTETLNTLLKIRRSCREFSEQPVLRADLEALLWAAAGVSDGDDHRTAPSAHARYPIRILLVAGNVEGLETGLHLPADGDGDGFSLQIKGDLRPALESAALEEQPWIGRAAAILALTADMPAARAAFIEQPPRGLRGERYVHMEAGAMAQNIHLCAAARGLGGVLVAGFDDLKTGGVLGLSAPMSPVLLFCVGHPA